jgi:hexulose-6-phosphate isomerase
VKEKPVTASFRSMRAVTPRRIGVMQGRLSERPGAALQAFPAATWEREFSLAKSVGFECIEWVLDSPPDSTNPLWSPLGREGIRRASASTGVKVSSICADYFMTEQLAGPDAARTENATNAMKRVIAAAAEVGAGRILIPLVEQAALPTQELRDGFVHSIRQCVSVAEAHHVVLALEMEIPGPEYAAFVQSVGHPSVRACYDTGNSTAQGFDIGTDIVDVIPYLDAIHVKDRLVRGTSQPLGSGQANFEGLFDALARHGFHGDVILQHYFASDPMFDALRSLNFVKVGFARAEAQVA